MKYKVQFLIVSLFFLISCSISTENESEDSVLSYNEHNLNLKELLNYLPKDLSVDDSLKWVKQFEKTWLRNQIIIQKSEKELPKKELDIELELLQYKSDLLLYKYENFYIKNKINTQVSNSEIENFYKENKSVLLSLNPLVKATYIVIPNTVRDKYKVRQWLVSSREKDADRLKLYCFHNAKVFDDFDGEWIALEKLRLMSASDKLRVNRGIENRVIEQKNDSVTHYIFIDELVKKGEVMPLDYARDEIVKIIINKRKNILENELNQKLDEQVEKVYSK